MSKPLHESGGSIKTDYFNLGVLFILGLINLIDQITKNENIIDKIHLTIPFLLLSFLVYHKYTSRAIKSLVFITFGVIYEIYAIPDSSYLGASVFFVLSYMQYSNIKFGVFVSIITLITVVIKSTESSHTPSQTIGVLLAFVFIFGNIYNEIQRWKDKIKYLNNYYIDEITKLKDQLNKALKGEIEPLRNIDIINLTQEDKAILHLFCRGYSYELINKTLRLNVHPKTIRARISKIQKSNEKKILKEAYDNDEISLTDALFAKWLYQTL